MLPDESMTTFCTRLMPQYELVASLFSGPSASAPPNVVAPARLGTGGGERALPQRSIFIGGAKQVTEPADTDRSDIYEPRIQDGRAKAVAATATARVAPAQKHATAPSRGPS
jgi:hypothetical protein